MWCLQSVEYTSSILPFNLFFCAYCASPFQIRWNRALAVSYTSGV